MVSEESIMPEDVENNTVHALEHNLDPYIGSNRINKKSHMEKCEKLQWTDCLLAQGPTNGFGSLSVILAGLSHPCAGQEGSRGAFRPNTHNFHVGFSPRQAFYLRK